MVAPLDGTFVRAGHSGPHTHGQVEFFVHEELKAWKAFGENANNSEIEVAEAYLTTNHGRIAGKLGLP